MRPPPAPKKPQRRQSSQERALQSSMLTYQNPVHGAFVFVLSDPLVTTASWSMSQSAPIISFPSCSNVLKNRVLMLTLWTSDKYSTIRFEEGSSSLATITIL